MMKPYKLLKAWRVYNAGEIVGIAPEQVKALQEAGVIGKDLEKKAAREG